MYELPFILFVYVISCYDYKVGVHEEIMEIKEIMDGGAFLFYPLGRDIELSFKIGSDFSRGYSGTVCDPNVPYKPEPGKVPVKLEFIEEPRIPVSQLIGQELTVIPTVPDSVCIDVYKPDGKKISGLIKKIDIHKYFLSYTQGYSRGIINNKGTELVKKLSEVLSNFLKFKLALDDKKSSHSNSS